MTTISNFTTDLNLNLITNISGPRMIIPHNNQLGLRISTIDNSNNQLDYLSVDSQINKVVLPQMTQCTGLDVINALSVGGALAITRNSPFSTDGIIETTSVINSDQFGNGALVVRGGAYIAKNVYIAQDITVVGNAYKTGGGSWSSISDKRVKDNIKDVDINKCIESINNISIKTYDFKQDYLEQFKLESRQQIGVIADELELTHPHLVKKLENGPLGLEDFKTVNMSETQFEAIACIKYLIEQNKELRNEVELLKEKVSKL